MLDLVLQLSPILAIGIGCIFACVYACKKYYKRPSTDPEDWRSGDSDLFNQASDPLLAHFKDDVYLD